MFFEQQVKWTLVLCLSLFTFQAVAQSNSAIPLGLNAQPNKCVALNQGRECFANVLINWRLKQANDYCLRVKHDDGKLSELKCWQQTNSGQLSYAFQSAKGLQFILTRRTSDKPIASASIQVSWLYQSSTRKRRWRLF